MKKFKIFSALTIFLFLIGFFSLPIFAANDADIYISTSGKDKDEREEFGFSRYEAAKEILENSFPGIVVARDNHKVSGYDKIWIEGPGASDETTLSRSLMKKISKIKKPTIEDLCRDQKSIFEKAVEEENESFTYREDYTRLPATSYIPSPASSSVIPIPIPIPISQSSSESSPTIINEIYNENGNFGDDFRRENYEYDRYNEYDNDHRDWREKRQWRQKEDWSEGNGRRCDGGKKWRDNKKWGNYQSHHNDWQEYQNPEGGNGRRRWNRGNEKSLKMWNQDSRWQDRGDSNWHHRNTRKPWGQDFSSHENFRDDGRKSWRSDKNQSENNGGCVGRRCDGGKKWFNNEKWGRDSRWQGRQNRDSRGESFRSREKYYNRNFSSSKNFRNNEKKSWRSLERQSYDFRTIGNRSPSQFGQSNRNRNRDNFDRSFSRGNRSSGGYSIGKYSSDNSSGRSFRPSRSSNESYRGTEGRNRKYETTNNSNLGRSSGYGGRRH